MSAAFIRAMHDAGIPTDAEIIADGKLRRVHVEGDKHGTKNAWYVLHAGAFPAGAFGCNKRGISGKWRANQKREPLTQHDRARIEADHKARAIDRERGYSDAKVRGEQILSRATSNAVRTAYIARKGIQPHGVKVNEHGLLAVPVFSATTGQLQTVQFIDRDGNKKMLTGGRVTGGCFPFSDVPNFWANAEKRIGVCEGWASGATLAESLPTTAMFAAFSAGNLSSVALALRARFISAQITIYGDHDESGVGQKYAVDAAVNVNGYVAIPPTPGADWNDYARAAA